MVSGLPVYDLSICGRPALCTVLLTSSEESQTVWAACPEETPIATSMSPTVASRKAFRSPQASDKTHVCFEILMILAKGCER